MVQAVPQPGVNRISIEIIRPPDPTAPSGAGIIIGHGETTKEWQGSQVTLSLTGPPTALVNQEIPYTISIQNAGPVPIQAMTVRSVLPPGTQVVRAIPGPIIEANQLVWTLGTLAGGQTLSLQVTLQAGQPGPLTYCASVLTVENLRDEKCLTTQVAGAPAAIPPQQPAPQPPIQALPQQPATPQAPLTPQPVPPPPQARLSLTMSDVPSGYVGAPISFQITIVNNGTAPAANALLSASFDPALEHETKANPVELPLGTLGAGETKTVPLTLVPRRAGQFTARVAVTADGVERVEASRTVTVQAARMTVTKTGPTVRFVDKEVTWDITVTNSGDIPLNNVAVRDPLPAEVTFAGATQAGQFINGQVTWNLGNLGPREQRTVQVTARCNTLAPRVVNTAIATADPGLQEQAEAVLEIRGVPAFKLDVSTVGDPVALGGKVTYQIAVTNTGTLPANQVEIAAAIPKELQVTNSNGPTQARVEAGRVQFPPMDALQPRQTFNYSIEAQAIQVGDVRVRVELKSTALSQPVVKEVSTNIFNPGNGGPPPQPQPAIGSPPPGG
jgi:uncharacterized repeat protein (TIGR01451 family)